MIIKPILAGYLKLDGGAMFGVVPKSIWNKKNPADENNLCNWAMRCLYIEDGDKKILIDTGVGNKQSEKFFGYYYLSGETQIEKALEQEGINQNDITDVILTHLHFDHCGGAVNKALKPTFKNATYHVSKNQWENALKPNDREKASFFKENIIPLETSGNLQLIEKNKSLLGLDWYEVDGHSIGQIIPIIPLKNGKKLIYCADLIPASYHIPINYIISYDNQPLKSMNEKREVLNFAEKNKGILMFEHDPEIECASVTRSERGIVLHNTLTIKEL